MADILNEYILVGIWISLYVRYLIFIDGTRFTSAHVLCFITTWLAEHMHFSSLSLNSPISFYLGKKTGNIVLYDKLSVQIY
jgi:hypothetical protein